MCESFGCWNPSLRVGDLYLHMRRAGQETELNEGTIREDRSIGGLGGWLIRFSSNGHDCFQIA